MKFQKALKWMNASIAVLALFAAGMGLFYRTSGEPFAFTSLRGEEVMINARGLYYYDTVSSAAQMQANDLTTLVIGLPLLIISTFLALRGSLRGRLLMTGTLGFFLYTYMSMCFATAYNQLFLVYIALFTLSLFAFILAMMSFDLAALPAQFNSRLPRRGIAALLIAAGIFLLFAWVGGRILPTLLQGSVPALENVTTMVIQVLDLGLILPLAVLSGILLLKRQPWGYLLASVAVMKMLTMGIAVTGMGINMSLNGVPESPIIVIIFGLLALINLVLGINLLKSVQQKDQYYAVA
jgi:hypothetical protein